jgi:hypothetical protein
MEQRRPLETEIMLSANEEKFVFAVARGVRPSHAATSAGYSVGMASVLIRRSRILYALRSMGQNLADIVRSHLSAGA